MSELLKKLLKRNHLNQESSLIPEYLKNMTRYFAYGSNMNTDQMIKRGVVSELSLPAELRGYRLVFNARNKKVVGAGFANVVEDRSAVVRGVLHVISPTGILRLDRYEGFPNSYVRKSLPVILKNGETFNAIIYIASHSNVYEGLYPTSGYLENLLAGADFLPKEYVEWLKTIQTI